MKDKLLFVGPDLREVGGVSSYCRAIVENYPSEVEYFSFPVGMRSKPWVFLGVICNYFIKLVSRRDQIVQLNTSLNTNAIIRDAVLLYLGLLLGRRVIVFIHGWDEPFEKSLQGYRLRLFRYFFNRATLILVLGIEFKQKLLDLGFTANVVVETTCYSSELLSFNVDKDNHIKQEPIRILFISRVVKEKGVFELVLACASLVKRYPQLRLDIAGDGPDLEELKCFVRSSEATFVEFHGSVSGTEKWSLFERARIYCLPTYYGEGLPVTILEAMRFGLPVITTQIGGIVDVFVDKKNGFFVELKSQHDLTSKIEILLSDPNVAEKISDENYQRAVDFSPKVVAQRLSDLYSAL
jgi:glycosyltransferase involved in cell wall biosynthesis